jgi:hypothetical protein
VKWLLIQVALNVLVVVVVWRVSYRGGHLEGWWEGFQCGRDIQSETGRFDAGDFDWTPSTITARFLLDDEGGVFDFEKGRYV